MKITLNANITPDTVTTFLNKQKNKVEKIKEFCKTNKIDVLQYKDSELEYEYISDSGNKQFANPKPKVETRAKGG